MVENKRRNGRNKRIGKEEVIGRGKEREREDR